MKVDCFETKVDYSGNENNKIHLLNPIVPNIFFLTAHETFYKIDLMQHYRLILNKFYRHLCL